MKWLYARAYFYYDTVKYIILFQTSMPAIQKKSIVATLLIGVRREPHEYNATNQWYVTHCIEQKCADTQCNEGEA